MAFQAKRLGSMEAKRHEDTTYQDWVVQLPGLKTDCEDSCWVSKAKLGSLKCVLRAGSYEEHARAP